jgi:O-antigen/teichoic acid export membrane protein
MVVFGAWTLLISLTAFISLNAQALLIGALMPVAAVAYFSLAAGFWRQLGELLNPVGAVMYPAAAALQARGELRDLEQLYHDGSRLMLLATIGVVSIAWFWAEDFYRLWIGEKYLSGTTYPSVASVLKILLVAMVMGYFSNVAGQILLATGRVRLAAILLIAGGALNLVMTLIMIRPFGIYGVAVAILVASAVVDLIVRPYVLQRALGLRVADFLLKACFRPALVALLLLPVLWGAHRLTGPAPTLFVLVLQGALAGTCTLVLVLALGMTASERRRFVAEPLRRLVKRKHSGVESPPGNRGARFDRRACEERALGRADESS